jgi:hypothetical protein
LNVVFFLLGDSPANEFCFDVSEPSVRRGIPKKNEYNKIIIDYFVIRLWRQYLKSTSNVPPASYGVSCTSALKMEAEHSSEMHISKELHCHIQAAALRTANLNQ